VRTCSTQGLNETMTPSGRRLAAAEGTTFAGPGRSRNTASAAPARSAGNPCVARPSLLWRNPCSPWFPHAPILRPDAETSRCSSAVQLDVRHLTGRCRQQAGTLTRDTILLLRRGHLSLGVPVHDGHEVRQSVPLELFAGLRSRAQLDAETCMACRHRLNVMYETFNPSWSAGLLFCVLCDSLLRASM